MVNHKMKSKKLLQAEIKTKSWSGIHAPLSVRTGSLEADVRRTFENNNLSLIKPWLMIKHSSLLLVLEKPWIHNSWETLPDYQNIFIKLPTTMLSKVLYRYQPRSLYNSFVQFTCTIYLYSLLVRFICTVHFYDSFVQFICSNYLYYSYVQITSTIQMYNSHVQFTCTIHM